MNYLLDTNIISETIKPKPNKNVINWLDQVDPESIYISTLTLGEIRRGIERLDDYRKNKYRIWLEKDLSTWIQSRIIPVNIEVADKWGYICANLTKNLLTIDTLLAATALTYNLKLVTRNEKDFMQFKGLELINPY